LGAVHFDNGTAQPNLSSGNVKKYLIAVPPIAEQRRIVAKVDELMALCDQLETSLTSADETRKKLLDALLADALATGEYRDAAGGCGMSDLPQKPRSIRLRSFYGFGPEQDGYLGWTQEADRDRMLKWIEDGNQA